MLQLDGLQAQLHASNLLGSLQVVIEDVIGDMLRMKQDQPDKSQRVRRGCCGVLA